MKALRFKYTIGMLLVAIFCLLMKWSDQKDADRVNMYNHKSTPTCTNATATSSRRALHWRPRMRR
jgi:hypothetical protein